MAEDRNNPKQLLQAERGKLENEENRAKRQEHIRKGQLARMKQARRITGKVAGKTTKAAVETPITAAQLGFEGLEKVLDVATLGAYTPIDAATTAAQGLIYPIKKGLGKGAEVAASQAAQAPFRAAEKVQKARIRSSKKKKEQAKAQRRQVEKALSEIEGAEGLNLMNRFISLAAKSLGFAGSQITTISIGLILSIISPLLVFVGIIVLYLLLISSI